ncbi:sperm-egg fusion protein TMEM95 isoform X2 [Paroedura picta]|uniref:sperm-egg fusion protein TMEM95 isoform X2 n=1 Tax=Paroedura picta TaxID=143630 RepID=UPI0040576C93
MASAAFAPRGAPPAPTAATLLLLLLLLAGGGLEAEGCLPCRLHFKNLKGRFARLCAQYRERFGRQNCTSYPWGRGSFQGFALDELSLDLILEKTHRVFRVIEINQTLEDFPKFWDWLHERCALRLAVSPGKGAETPGWARPPPLSPCTLPSAPHPDPCATTSLAPPERIGRRGKELLQGSLTWSPWRSDWLGRFF